MAHHSEAAKVRDLPNVMKYITGQIIDIACGNEKITPEAVGVDGRDLPGVDIVTDDLITLWDTQLYGERARNYDTVFSSHFLEHVPDPYHYIMSWQNCLKPGGHLVLYLPDGDHYNNRENEEHMQDMKYAPFLFWFRRSFCGEGKDFRGNHFPKVFDLVEHGMDVGEQRYSFYIVSRKV
jgi:SAM-dependent methyltransferase